MFVDSFLEKNYTVINIFQDSVLKLFVILSFNKSKSSKQEEIAYESNKNT